MPVHVGHLPGGLLAQQQLDCAGSCQARVAFPGMRMRAAAGALRGYVSLGHAQRMRHAPDRGRKGAEERIPVLPAENAEGDLLRLHGRACES